MSRLFGTDGIRGIANSDLSCELALSVGRAAAAVLTEGYRRRPIFVVGTDTRNSAVVHNNNHICVHNGGNALCDYYLRAVFKFCFERKANLRLGSGVNGTC